MCKCVECEKGFERVEVFDTSAKEYKNKVFLCVYCMSDIRREEEFKKKYPKISQYICNDKVLYRYINKK